MAKRRRKTKMTVGSLLSRTWPILKRRVQPMTEIYTHTHTHT